MTQPDRSSGPVWSWPDVYGDSVTAYQGVAGLKLTSDSPTLTEFLILLVYTPSV